MKKSLVIAFASTTILFFGQGISRADQFIIAAGDQIKLVSYNHQDNAGIMNYAIYDSAGKNQIGTLDTFCIQDNVYINPGVMYTIKSITNQVGMNGNLTWTERGYVQQVNNNIAGTGKLNGAVDYLYHQYYIGKYDAELESRNGQTDLQKLLWSLQDSGFTYTDTDPTAHYSWDDDYAAYQDPHSGLQGAFYNTLVLNIVGKDSNGNEINVQNQLYDPVPEPAAMLLFGTGLIGLAGVVRRKMN